VRLATKYNIYAYDAYLLWCAVIMKVPLLCPDKAMANLAKEMGIKTIEVL
jgi:predicted nucleic acid-binding protein